MKEITYAEYYSTKYEIKIKELKQNLIKVIGRIDKRI